MGIIAGGGLPGGDEGRGGWLRSLLRSVFVPQGSGAPKGSRRTRIVIWAVVIAVIVVPLALRRL